MKKLLFLFVVGISSFAQAGTLTVQLNSSQEESLDQLSAMGFNGSHADNRGVVRLAARAESEAVGINGHCILTKKELVQVICKTPSDYSLGVAKEILTSRLDVSSYDAKLSSGLVDSAIYFKKFSMKPELEVK